MFIKKSFKHLKKIRSHCKKLNKMINKFVFKLGTSFLFIKNIKFDLIFHLNLKSLPKDFILRIKVSFRPDAHQSNVANNIACDVANYLANSISNLLLCSLI